MPDEVEINFLGFGPVVADAKPDVVAVGYFECTTCGHKAWAREQPYLVSVVSQCPCGTTYPLDHEYVGQPGFAPGKRPGRWIAARQPPPAPEEH